MKSVCVAMKEEFARSESVCAQTLMLFHLISNKARFRIICLLTRGDFCVQDIADVVAHGNLSNISQQLKILRLAGLIDRRRDDRKLIYHLKDERVRTMIGFLRDQFLGVTP